MRWIISLSVCIKLVQIRNKAKLEVQSSSWVLAKETWRADEWVGLGPDACKCCAMMFAHI